MEKVFFLDLFFWKKKSFIRCFLRSIISNFLFFINLIKYVFKLSQVIIYFKTWDDNFFLKK